MIAMRLEGVDGTTQGDWNYDSHDLLRPFKIAQGGHWYEQNRQDGDTWVYRQMTTVAGAIPDDTALQSTVRSTA